MSRNNAANSLRTMKWIDYSHSIPKIFIPKPYVSALAHIIKRQTGMRHRVCVTLVGRCFCGVEKCFNEYYKEQRYDLDFQEAMVFHKDIVSECILNLSALSGVNESLITDVLNLPIVHKLTGASRHPKTVETVEWTSLIPR